MHCSVFYYVAFLSCQLLENAGHLPDRKLSVENTRPAKEGRTGDTFWQVFLKARCLLLIELDDPCKHVLRCFLSQYPALIFLDTVQSLEPSEDINVRCYHRFSASFLKPILFPCLLASINTSLKPQFLNLLPLPMDSSRLAETKIACCSCLLTKCVN